MKSIQKALKSPGSYSACDSDQVTPHEVVTQTLGSCYWSRIIKCVSRTPWDSMGRCHSSI